MKTVTLYRPIGPEELQLIEQSGWTKFPPRLPEQPIFYPVMNEAYAVQIARLERSRQWGWICDPIRGRRRLCPALSDTHRRRKRAHRVVGTR